MNKLMLISLLFLVGCSSQWHLKRAIKKDPSILQVDTIVHRDTINTHTESVEVDSTFIVSKDTVIIIKDNLTIKHWIHNDSVFITGLCDTIFLEIPYEVAIPVDRWIEPKESWLKDNWLSILIVLAMVLLLYKIGAFKKS